jgi:hypothetical protein
MLADGNWAIPLPLDSEDAVIAVNEISGGKKA